MKKYCECFQAGIKCSEKCKCIRCKNCEHVPTNFADEETLLEERLLQGLRQKRKLSEAENDAFFTRMPSDAAMRGEAWCD